MTRIKIHISNVKLPFYPPCEVKCGLQNRVSTKTDFGFQTRSCCCYVEWLTTCSNLDEYALKLHINDRDVTSLVKTFCY